MTIVVLDASAVGAFLLPDEGGAMKDLVRRAYRDHDVHVPPIWPTEVASLIINAVRRRRIRPERLARTCALAKVLQAAVVIAPSCDLDVAVDLAVANELSGYDATYALLALRLGAHLLTGDGALRRAAQSLGIDLIT